MRAWIGMAALACHCRPQPADETGRAGPGDTGAVACAVTLVSTDPVNGATDVYHRIDALEFRLSNDDRSATIETDIPGTPAWDDEGETLRWVLSGPLAPSTSYTARLHGCGGTYEIAFRTSALGAPLEAPEGLVGRTYALDLAEAHVAEPDGWAGLTAYFADPVLLGVIAVDGALTLRVAPSTRDPDVRQDWCEPSDEVAASFADSPYVEVGPVTTPVSAGALPTTLQVITVTGTFAADGDRIGGIVLTGLLDLRPLAPLFDESGDVVGVCENVLPMFGAVCEPCSDGEPSCLRLRLDEAEATPVDGTLVEIPAADCAGCGSAPPAVCP